MQIREYDYGKEDIKMIEKLKSLNKLDLAKKLMSNRGLKVLSLLCAVLLWLIVVNIDDPVTTKRFRDIPVKILNEKMIQELEETYEVIDESDKVTITVKAKRSVVESLSKDDFTATADFSERISENSIPIRVKAKKYEDKIVDIVLASNTVKISIEKKGYKTVPVEVVKDGNTAEGFTVGKVTVNPGKIELSGPQSIVSKLSKVVVTIDVNGVSEDLHITKDGVLYDKNNNVVKSDKIQGDYSNISVDVHMLHTKSVDLNISTEGEPEKGYWCQDIQYQPTTVLIAGEEADIREINTLEVPASELNINGARNNLVKTIDLTRYLPENVIFCNEEEKTITVTVVISRLEGREFRIPITSVDILNTPAGIDGQVINPEDVIVIIKGNKEELNKLKPGDIMVAVDIKDKGAGTYNLEAIVTVPGEFVVENHPVVTVKLVSSGGEIGPGDSPQPPLQSITPPDTTPSAVPSSTPTPVPSVEPAESQQPENGNV